MEGIITIVAALLVGTNIWQFIYHKIHKDKMRAEADKMRAEVEKMRALVDEEKIQAKHKGLDLMQDQADYLLNKLSVVQADYVALQTQMRNEMAEHTTTINTKCNEIAQLKSQVIYFKGIRCYKSDCSNRISQNPKDKEVANG